MTISPTTLPKAIELIPALEEQAAILANLLELYAYDFSEFMELQLGADGRFGYPRLPLYWQEANRHAFLIKVDGHLSGFVLLRQGSEISRDTEVWDMAEFFIMRGYRRLGIGMQVAHQVWEKFPGKWEVRVREVNQKAVKFWGRAIRQFLGQEIDSVSFEKNGAGWQVFSFDTTPTAAPAIQPEPSA